MMTGGGVGEKTCGTCSAEFYVIPAEAEILRKVFAPQLPVPDIRECPECRARRRLAFRNERHLYRRTCAMSGKPMISVYRPDSPFVVYDQSIWWSERYDPLAFGQEFDFTRPFFPQLAELHARVPKLSIHNSNSENCEYTNYSSENRNCYLAVGALQAESCLYSYRVFYSRDIVDSFGLSRSELCYECVQGANLYSCVYATNCQSSSNLFLCDDCIGCQDCFGCVNLRNRRHCIFNEQLSPEGYTKKLADLLADRPSARAAYERLRSSLPLRSTYTVNCEASAGDQIRNCRRCEDVYFVYDSEDVIHARNGDNDRDCADLNFGDNCELQYQASNLEKNYRVAFAALAWYTSESYYVLSCFNSKNLFGCCGMKKHEYCILNKQYTPADYEKMVGRIAAHMVETGEWGSFFPPSISPFLFSETVAAELFPLSDVDAKAQGFNVGAAFVAQEASPPSLSTPSCNVCSRQFRIVPQEEKFYGDMRLAPPEACPDCRHRARMTRRRPMKLRATSCARCAKRIATSAESGTVVCEECFVAE